MSYEQFLSQKKLIAPAAGITVPRSAIGSDVFDFQADLIRWSLEKGRAALFADTGLGKSRMQLKWLHFVTEHADGEGLIAAPLSVARQTVREAQKIGLNIKYVRCPDDIDTRLSRISITNYEMLHHFDPTRFVGIVPDESSILKAIDGKTRQLLTDMFRDTPYRLCCTATPAPNDIAEIGNHAEFLGIMTATEMLAAFFVHDDDGWRLKGHAEQPFFRWLASWGMSIRKPSDLGYSDEGYNLPTLTVHPHILEVDEPQTGTLFFAGLKGIQDRNRARKSSVAQRVQSAVDLVRERDGQWILWHGLNHEGELLKAGLPDAVLVEGDQTPEEKATAFERFQDGDFRVLITKPRIAGFGLNFQNCHQMAFIGLSDSWEEWYQCIRRCYRFGQQHPVQVHVVISEHEQDIYNNVMRKEREAQLMSERLIENVRAYEKAELGHAVEDWQYTTDTADIEGNVLMLGDSVERIKEVPDESIDLSVFSPPFVSLYTYTNTERDLGNSTSEEQFFRHFDFIIADLLRITKSGRICAVHVSDIPAMLVRDGYIGLRDFSGEVIRAFIKAGWIFDSRIPIDKNQQAQSIRTHAKGLTFTQLEKDRTWNRPALPDYILKFRKAGENAVPVRGGDMNRDLWIEWANPTWNTDDDRCLDRGAFATWYGIKESDTLQGWQKARSSEDERHICPLQLETIERCIRLWTNPGETVFTPFMGIGSEVYMAAVLERRAIGIELKPEYFRMAVKNCQKAFMAREQLAMPLVS